MLHRGRVVVATAKHHLPNYGVFDEYRYFVRGDRLPIFRLHGVDVAIAVCEDLWQEGGPVAVAAGGRRAAGVPNASPYEKEKDDVRLDAVRAPRARGRVRARLRQPGRRAGRAGLRRRLARGRRGRRAGRAGGASSPRSCWSPTWSCRSPTAGAGAFPFDAGDGTTITVERHGAVGPSRSRRTSRSPRTVAQRLDDCAEVYSALVLAVRDYVAKNGFQSVILGLSGGIDSALTATIAADAIGPRGCTWC